MSECPHGTPLYDYCHECSGPLQEPPDSTISATPSADTAFKGAVARVERLAVLGRKDKLTALRGYVSKHLEDME